MPAVNEDGWNSLMDGNAMDGNAMDLDTEGPLTDLGAPSHSQASELMGVSSIHNICPG